MSAVRIQAWKPADETHITPCNIADPEAIKFSVEYPAARYHHTLDFDNAFQAEQVGGAISAAFQAGKNAAMDELRNLIGAEPRK